MAGINRQELAEELTELLDLPKKKCLELIDTVIQVVKTALQEGQDVSIRGLGTFKIRERKSRMVPHAFLLNPRGDNKELHISPVPIKSRARKYIVFTPCASLDAWINIQGNFKLTINQRRAIRWWKQQ